MTNSEFQVWLRRNPEQWAKVDETSPGEDQASLLPIQTPADYQQFLEDVGPLMLFREAQTSYELLLLGGLAVIERADFVHSLSHPEYGVVYDHLVPFCDTGFDNCCYCFAGEHIVEFDPSAPDLIEIIVSPTFGEFLDKMIMERGL